MPNRRDLFMVVPGPGRETEAEEALTKWLGELDGHPGYLGGALLRECADELLPGTLVLTLEFESTQAARAMWPKLRPLRTPVTADGDDRNPPDQGALMFAELDQSADARSHLDFNRGNGLLARVLHAHCEVVTDFAATGSGPLTDR